MKNLQLYEKIMRNISRSLKKSLNEYNVFGVEVDSLVLPKISDIDDIDKPVKFENKEIETTVNNIFDQMKKNVKYMDFLKTNNIMDTIILWSLNGKLKTACTDGYKGELYMNPEFMKRVYDNAGELGVQFIILHEVMHNYYNNVKHALKINTPGDNIIIDKRINNDIIFRWHEFKGVPEKIGALL